MNGSISKIVLQHELFHIAASLKLKELDAVKPSADFKREASRAIAAIVFFVLIYLLLIALAVGLTIACILAGLALIAFKPSFITLALGIGLASLGVLILIFLLKFASQSKKADLSHLLQVTSDDEPGLFRLIDGIVRDVSTKFPKKVFLTSDVNAAVFYDSNFWSMFLPVRKNLQIGLGLVNILTVSELKAVLAHEFGHFSQRSMKVGSYVYNVNQVIFNMLYENDGYQEMIQRWAGFSNYFSIFVIIAVKVVAGIQFILRKLYGVVNKSYLALSREMEFHADEIAARTAGSQALQLALLRLNIADQALNSVLEYYNARAKGNLRSKNIFREQTFVMNFIAERKHIPIINHFPEVTIGVHNQLNKSKLVLKNQWASHPTTEERVDRLQKLEGTKAVEHKEPAGSLFKNFELSQVALTDHVFKGGAYTDDVIVNSTERFQEGYLNEFARNSFPDVYNGYYDTKTPLAFTTYGNLDKGDQIIVSELFSNENVELLHNGTAIAYDLNVIKQISTGAFPITTFDYDGRKYKASECASLLSTLEKEASRLNGLIEKIDERVYHQFKLLEQAQGGSRLSGLYSELAQYEKNLGTDIEFVQRFSGELQFTHQTTPIERINENFRQMRPLESELKDRIREILKSNRYHAAITQDMRSTFEKFVSQEWEYFGVQTYMEKNLELLITSLNLYGQVISSAFFLLKKELLIYQIGLIPTGATQD